jgi:hypothetical protein
VNPTSTTNDQTTKTDEHLVRVLATMDETFALQPHHQPPMALSSASYENNNNMINNTSNASISFDLTIELTASNDDEESVHGPPPTEHNNNNGAGIRSIGGDTSTNKAAMMTIVPKKIIRNPKNGKYKIVLPLVSPDDGSISVWGAEDEEAAPDEEEEEASTASSLASSKQSMAGSRSTTSTNRLVRFQGITAYQYPAGFRQGGGGVNPKGKVANYSGLGTSAPPGTNLEKLQIDVERQRALRKRKERALIKIAKELSKRTHEVTQRDQRIAAQVETIHQLEQQLLIVTQQQQEQLTKISATTTHSSSAETMAAAQDETTAHLRKELLRLQLSNDRLQLQLSNNSRIPPMLLALVLIAILLWLLQSTILTAAGSTTSSSSCSS